MIRLVAIYVAVVFGAGFTFGLIREFVVVPIVGGRRAELIEFPMMLIVILWTARSITRHESRLVGETRWLRVGFFAAAVVLIADFAVGVFLRGMTIRAVMLERDPVNGTIYYLMMLTLALAPVLFARFNGRKVERSQA